MSISFDYKKDTKWSGGTAILVYEDKKKGVSVNTGAFCVINFQIKALSFKLTGGIKIWDDIKHFVKIKDSVGIIKYATQALLSTMDENILAEIIRRAGMEAHYKLIDEYQQWEEANPMLKGSYVLGAEPCNLCGSGPEDGSDEES